MRATQWVVSLFLLGSLYIGSAMASDAAPAVEQAPTEEVAKLEKISNAPAATKSDMKDCPMHQGQKECNHKNGEPCPYHQGKKHHGKSHEKNDQKQQS